MGGAHGDGGQEGHGHDTLVHASRSRIRHKSPGYSLPPIRVAVVDGSVALARRERESPVLIVTGDQGGNAIGLAFRRASE